MSAHSVSHKPGGEVGIGRSGLPWLTKYERTKIIGMRAEQLARGAEPFVPPVAPDGGRFDACELAERELEARVLPFIIVRRMPDGRTEHVRLDAPDLAVGGPSGRGAAS